MYNTIITACHLVSDPELRKTGTGKSVCSMRVGISDSKTKDKAYLDVELWERQAEVAAEYLKKGREIILQGTVCMSTWGEGDDRRSKFYIKAQNFTFLNSGKKEEGDDAQKSTQESTNAKGGQAADAANEDVPF